MLVVIMVNQKLIYTFSEKDSSIQKHNNIIKNLVQIYYKYKNSHKPPFFNIVKKYKDIIYSYFQ